MTLSFWFSTSLQIELEMSRRPFLNCFQNKTIKYLGMIAISDGSLTKSSRDKSQAVLKLTSLISHLATRQQSSFWKTSEERASHDPYNRLKGTHSSIRLGDDESSLLKFTAIIDPVADISQKIVSILEVIGSIDGVYLEIFFQVSLSREEEKMPLQRFYRYVLDPAPRFLKNGYILLTN